MERPKPPDQFRRIDPDHPPIPKQRLQRLQRPPVILAPIRRHQNNSVGDVKIRVARRQALTRKKERDGLERCVRRLRDLTIPNYGSEDPGARRSTRHNRVIPTLLLLS